MTYATLAHAEAWFPVTAKHGILLYSHEKVSQNSVDFNQHQIVQ